MSLIKFEETITDELIQFAETLKTLVFDAIRKAHEEFVEGSKRLSSSLDLSISRTGTCSHVIPTLSTTPTLSAPSSGSSDQRHLLASPYGRSDSGYSSDLVPGDARSIPPLECEVVLKEHGGSSKLPDIDSNWFFQLEEFDNSLYGDGLYVAGLEFGSNPFDSSLGGVPLLSGEKTICLPDYNIAEPAFNSTPSTFADNEAIFVEDTPSFQPQLDPCDN